MDVTSILDSLNDAQRSAVAAPVCSMLVLAGAGSGKTRVLVHRIAWLVQAEAMSPYSVMAVTFTNKAAAEMRSRIEELLGIAPRGMWVGTFHGLSHRLLRSHWQEAGLPENFQILDSDDQLRIIKRIMKAMQLDEQKWPPRQAQWFINSKKDEGLRPDYIDPGYDPFERTMVDVYRRYHDYCEQAAVVDFGELLLRAHELLLKRPDVLQHYRERFRYILVDEFQDTNAVQYAWLRLLAGDQDKLMVVGDDDQSIYAWRGAKPENLAQLKEDYPSLKVIKLEQNYRSTSRILKAANTLIANNPHVFDKTLWSEMGVGDEIRVIKCRNDEMECERIATEILAHKLRHENQYKDYAVLYRGNFQSRLLELKLQHHGIPYHINGGTSFFARAEVKDIMAYLRLLINQDDDNAFLRVVNTPKREIGPSTLEKLGNYANQHHISLYQSCQEAALGEDLAPQYVQKLRRFTDWMDNVSRQLQTSDDPMQVVREMIADSDYENWLMQHSSSPAQAEKRIANVWFLVDALQQTLERGDEDRTVADAIARLILRDMLERNEEEEDTDRVQLLTLHASKGLEYPHVFMMGMEEELLPHRTSIEEDNIEEERRLTYVGITRARKSLTMTLAGQRKQFGEIIDTMPSRFLDELPQEDLVYSGFDASSTQETKKMAGKMGLDALYKSIGA